MSGLRFQSLRSQVSGLRSQVSGFRFQVSGFRFASFAPAHVALRAACGRLPGQRPLTRVQVSGLKFHSLLFIGKSFGNWHIVYQ